MSKYMPTINISLNAVLRRTVNNPDMPLSLRRSNESRSGHNCSRIKTPIEWKKNGRVSIVCGRSRVKILDTGSLDSLLFVKGQLFQHPVVVRLIDVCVPRFPISHDLSRYSVMGR